MRSLFIIAGPTASGKTDLALELAERYGGEIIGADSVQVYRGFDIGSAKPSAEELRGIPHAMIDILDPDESMDAMRFAELADQEIEASLSRGKKPIVVGGTGLWIRALLRGLVDLPRPDPEVRSALETEIERKGSAYLHRRLREVDPLSAEAIHENDSLRIVRALEVYEQTGEALGELRRRHALGSPRYSAVFAVLDPSLDELTPRIERRLEAMLEAGWLEEARSLRERYGDKVRPFGSVGYLELAQHLRGEIDLDETKKRIRKATRIYARRQKTWFGSERDITLRGDASAIATSKQVLDYFQNS